MTKIYLDNHDKFGAVTYPLLDLSSDVYVLKDSQLTREIKDHMKTGSYTFTILPEHPAYDKILLKRSIVRVEDDEQIVFRGDVVKIDTDKYGVKKVTCQNDLKWLVDVQDIFSKIVRRQTVYNISDTEDHAISLYFYDTYDGGVVHEYDGLPVYNHIMRQAATATIDGGNPYADCRFKATDVGKIYTVQIQHETEGIFTYECELREYVEGGMNLLYLGNVNMSPTIRGRGADWQEFTFDPARIDLTGMTATDISEGVPAEEATVNLVDLNWCIITTRDGLDLKTRGKPVTTIYTTLEPPTVGVTQPHHISILCSTTSQTTVGSMVNSVFCEYNAATLTGYNACVDEIRRIYRGRIEVDGEIENSDVGTVYSNLSRWLDVTGGYASIRYVGDIAFIDLLQDSGTEDDSFSVALGENVSDYGKSEDVLNLVTGMYPVGDYTPEETDDEDEPAGEDDEPETVTLVNAVLPSENKDFELDRDLGIVYHREARRRYGTVIAYQNYDLAGIVQNQRQNHIYRKACDEILTMLEAFTSFDVSAHDPRLLGKTGAAPVLGNYYKVDIPLWGGPTYMRLSKIITNHVKPSADRLTFGDERAALSDYAAKGAKK